MPFRIQFIFCLDVFLRRTSPSSLYKSVDCLSSLFDKKGNIWMPTSSHILAQLKLPMVMVKQLSVFFFFQGSLLLTKISYNVLLYVSLFLEYQCIAGKIGLYCLIFLRI